MYYHDPVGEFTNKAHNTLWGKTSLKFNIITGDDIMLKFLRSISGLQLWGIVIAVIAAAALWETVTSKDDPTINIDYTPSQEVSQETEAVALTETEPERAYVVREHGGIIAVFEGGGNLPVLTVQVPVSSLPEEDRLLLKEGVSFDSYGAMVAFLENYE